MSDDYTEMIILCEDKQQEVFLRRYLIKNGINSRRIRVRAVPAGSGSGEQWVREEYPKEMREHRSRATRLHIGLVVMQDADQRSSNESSRELEEQLKASGQSPRSVAERVGLFFPRRNIETWIEFLNTGSPADEKKRYPKLTEESDCYTGVDKLAAKNDYHLSSDVPASLRAACPEIRRIFPQKSCIDESAGTA